MPLVFWWLPLFLYSHRPRHRSSLARHFCLRISPRLSRLWLFRVTSNTLLRCQWHCIGWCCCCLQWFVRPMHRNILQLTPIGFKMNALRWLLEHINPHFFVRQMLNFDFSFVHFIFHKEELHLDVLRSFAARKFSVGLQKNSALVVLINRSMCRVVTLLLQKIKTPQDGQHGIIHPYKLAFGRTSHVAFLLSQKTNHCTLSKYHTSLAFSIFIHSMGGVHQPFCTLQIMDG